jgi:hypothetical protein
MWGFFIYRNFRIGVSEQGRNFSGMVNSIAALPALCRTQCINFAWAGSDSPKLNAKSWGSLVG